MPDNTKITHPVALDATLQNVATNIRGLSQTLTPAVDANMSTVSTNPVQNKVITTAVNDKISTVSMTKQDDGTRKLTFTKGNGTTSEYDLSYDIANASNPGLESSDHYTKLEGIAAGAEVNQNAFSSFTGENGEVVVATNKEDSVKIIGVNIDLDFNPGGEGENLISISAYSGTTDGVTLTAYASGSNAGKIGLAGEALTSDFEYVVCDNLSDYLTVGEEYHIKGCPHLTPSSSDPGLGEVYLIYYNKNDPMSMYEVGNKDTGDGIVITHRANYNRLSIIVKQGTVINTIGGQYACYFTPKVYQEIAKSITFTGNADGGGEDWNVALDGTVDYSKPSDNYLEIYHENFPYTDEHPEELTFSINQYDLLTNFNDIDINENGSDISQIQIHKGCWTHGATSALETFYRYNFKHSHLCPYNNKEYSFYYYAYKNNTGYKYEIWTDNGSLIFNATENKFYVASYGGETYEASLSGDYPDAFIYDKIGTRYTYNGNFNIDNGSLFIYNPSVSADVSGINALYNYYSENFPTFKLITDFKKGVMYDYYFYIPYYYPTLSYMLNDQIDMDGNTVHAEFVVKGGAETPSTGDEVLVKRHFYRGAPLVIDINDEGYSPEYITYTSDFLSKVNIFADEEENYAYQWFEDDSRVAGSYQLSMHIEYPKFDPYNYLTKNEAANTYLNKNDVDANMSTVSTNPVQNAVVTTAVNNNISTVSMTKSNDGTRKLTFEKGNGSTFEHDLSYAQATDSVLGLVKVNGSTGTSTTDVMSQKAVTDELSAIKNITDNFTIENGELCILVDEQNNGGSSNGTVSKAISLNETLQDIADTLDGMSDNIDSVAASTAAETTTNWLNQHVDPQSQTIIDDSLTISGAAADAKVTGDKIGEVKSALSNIVTASDIFTFYQGAVGNITQTIDNIQIQTSTTRIRSIVDFDGRKNKSVGGKYTIVADCDDGYAAIVQFYAVDDGSAQYSVINYAEGKQYYEAQEDSYAIATVKKIDNSDITPSDASHVRFYFITEVSKNIENDLEQTKLEIFGHDLFTTMYQGGFGAASQGVGINYLSQNTDTNRIRTFPNDNVKNCVIPAKTDIYISCDLGYEIAYQVYSITSSLALDVFQWSSNDVHIKKTEDVWFVAMGRKTNGEDLSPSDASHFRFSYISDSITDEIKTKVDFSKSQSLSVAEKAMAQSNIGIVGNTKITLPFTSNLGVNIYKNRDKYVTDFKPQSKAITKTNGVFVFLSPDGNDSNNGRTVSTPKLTFSSALEVTNVCTIVLLKGTYEAGTHFTNGQTISTDINIIGIGDVKIDSKGGNPISFSADLYCENVEFTNGVSAFLYEASSADNTCCLYHCEFTKSTTANGMSIKGGKAYVVECVASGNGYDGFNYHANDSVLAESIEIDCVAFDNGHYNLSGADGQSSNGSTSHDACSIIRVNGEYYACHGGVVADKECDAVCYGSKSGISTITDSNYPDRMSNYWNSGGHTWLYDCVSYGSKYDTAVILSGVITSNVVYPSNYPS